MEFKIIGFDIGINGGIAVYNGKIKTYKMPTKIKIVNGKKRKTYDILKIKDIIETEKPNIAVIEKVWAIPSDGKIGAFTFGYGLGVISALCESMIEKVFYIPAYTWKKYFGLNNEKKKSVELCNKIFGTNFKVKDHNEAEALLLIKYYLDKEVKNE